MITPIHCNGEYTWNDLRTVFFAFVGQYVDRFWPLGKEKAATGRGAFIVLDMGTVHVEYRYDDELQSIIADLSDLPDLLATYNPMHNFIVVFVFQGKALACYQFEMLGIIDAPSTTQN